jgi:hypothetical protein
MSGGRRTVPSERPSEEVSPKKVRYSIGAKPESSFVPKSKPNMTDFSFF